MKYFTTILATLAVLYAATTATAAVVKPMEDDITHSSPTTSKTRESDSLQAANSSELAPMQSTAAKKIVETTEDDITSPSSSSSPPSTSILSKIDPLLFVQSLDTIRRDRVESWTRSSNRRLKKCWDVFTWTSKSGKGGKSDDDDASFLYVQMADQCTFERGSDGTYRFYSRLFYPDTFEFTDMPFQQERKLPTGEFFSEFHTNYFEEDQQPNTAFTLIDEGISDGVVVSAVASSFVASSNEEGRPSYGYILYQSDSQVGVRPLSEVLDGKSEKTFVHCSIFIDSLHRRRKRKRTTRRPTPRPTTRRPTPRPTPQPTTSPSVSFQPTTSPTDNPSTSPSISAQPTTSPSDNPSTSPSISAQPTTSPSAVRCPCFDQDDLSAVTPDKDPSCTVRDYGGGESFDLTYGDRKFFETSPADEPGIFQCGAGSTAGPSSGKKISKEQYKRCFQELEDRCDEIHTPVETIVCPCFGQDDLLVATSEDFEKSFCPSVLSTADALNGPYSFGITPDNFCFSAPRGQYRKLPTTVLEGNLCYSLLLTRCVELGWRY